MSKQQTMDPGTVIAVAQISAQILSLIVKYYSGVKNAKADIERLQTEVRTFRDVLQKVQDLAQDPRATKLSTWASYLTTINQSLKDVTELESRLNPGKRRKTIHRVGLHAFMWPLTSKEVDKYIGGLERQKTALILALNTDQT